jgi:hypothetical protein
LDIDGAQFVPPAKGQLLFGNPSPPAPLAFGLRDGGIDSCSQFGPADPVSLAAQLRTGNVVAVTQTLPSTVKFAPSFNAATGLLSGSVNLLDSVDGKPITRTLSYNGLYIPNLDVPGGSAVRGFFLLPELPSSSDNASTTSILSGVSKVLRNQ